jgi:uncharacterized protein YkwD
MRGFVIAVFVLAACSGRGPQLLGAQASRRGAPMRTSPVGPVTFAPTSAPAIHYNEPAPPVPRTPLNDAVIAAVREAAVEAGLRIPAPDARLFRACGELAEIVPEEGIVGYKLVEFALQRNGIIEPSPHLLVVWGDIDSPALIVEQLQPRLAEILRDGATARLGVGIAKRHADGTGAVVFALQGSGVTTAPIPRAIAAGGTVVIDAVVDPRYRAPEVFVTRGDGSTQRIEHRPGRPGGFVAHVPCSPSSGREQIEITASDAAGSTVLANFPVWCGAEPPPSVTADPAHDDAPAASPEQAELRLLANVNRDRGVYGLPPLSWDDQLAAVSRGHSDEMQRTGSVAHISPVTGSAADRVRAAGVRTAVVLENVARAYGVNEAHDGLMNSPGHRANLMSNIATHVGIGVTFGQEISGRREMFITQVFTRVPPKIDPASAVATVQRALVAQRRTLASDGRLGDLAQAFAEGLAAGKSREVAYGAVKGRLEQLGRYYVRVGTVITATAELESFDGAGLLADVAATTMGVGVAQGRHPELGDDAIWIVALFAIRR